MTTLKSIGGNAHLTVLQRIGHDGWTDPMRDGIMDWMLAQRKGALCWAPAGCYPWRWWHVAAIPGAFLVFMRLGWHFEQRRRRRMSSVADASEPEAGDADFSLGPFQEE